MDYYETDNLVWDRSAENLRYPVEMRDAQLGLEQAHYKQSFKNLFEMIVVWNRGYDQEGIHKILEITDHLAHKRVIVKNNKVLELTLQERFGE